MEKEIEEEVEKEIEEEEENKLEFVQVFFFGTSSYKVVQRGYIDTVDLLLTKEALVVAIN